MINVTRTSLPSLKKYTTYLEKIWESRWITNNGCFLQELEKRLKKYLGVDNLLLVSNGTLAIQLALKGLDLKGEVITTPFTFAATTNAIVWEGLTPVFADIDPETFNIDPRDIEKKITKNTCAILAVNVYGNTCEIEKLQKIAKKYKIKLVYDAAHSFGTHYKNRSSLIHGDCSTLSFHATKVFHTIEGGAIVVKNKFLFNKLKLLRNFGIVEYKEKFSLAGINAKMNEFQAIMGLLNLKEVDSNIAKRKVIFKKYQEAFSNIKNIKLQKIVNSKHNYMYMPICLKNRIKRDRLYSELIKNDIKPRKYFFPLTTEFDYLKKQGSIDKKSLRTAYNISDRVLCLPIYPELTIGIVNKIIRVVKNNS